MTGPFGQVVVHVDNPQAVKNVAGGFECSRDPGYMPEVEKGRKREPHPAPLVGDRRSTAAAADLARQDSLVREALTVEEPQVIDPCRYSHVPLMKNGRPLHGRAVQFLAGEAMADFGVHGIGTHLVLNRTAMASGMVFGYKILILDRCVIRA